MREQISCRDSTNQVPEMTAAGAIVEAQGIARKIVEHERGACGGSTELAIYRASSLYGVDETSIRALWHRRARKFVASHVMDALRQADKYLEARPPVNAPSSRTWRTRLSDVAALPLGLLARLLKLLTKV